MMLVLAMEFSGATRSSRRALTTDFGGHSGGVTPVPIPNTEVKPTSADGTWGEIPWESRTPPDFAPKRPARARSRLAVLRRHVRAARYSRRHAGRPTASSRPRRRSARSPGPSAGPTGSRRSRAGARPGGAGTRRAPARRRRKGDRCGGRRSPSTAGRTADGPAGRSHERVAGQPGGAVELGHVDRAGAAIARPARPIGQTGGRSSSSPSARASRATAV